MPGQNEEEHQDYLYRAYGLLGFIIFLLTAFISLIFAMDIKEYSAYLTIVTVTSLCISIVFCVCIVWGNSKQNYRRVRGQEPGGLEEIELDEMPASRRKDSRRHSIDYVRSLFNLPPLQTDSDGSSKSEDDPDVQETLAFLARQKLAAAANAAGYPSPGGDERYILETAADVYAEEETTEDPRGTNSDQIPSDPENSDKKVFRLSKLPFIDSDDVRDGIIESTERTLLKVNSPNSSTDEADSADNEVATKENTVE